MLLMLDLGVFFEFIPLNELNRENPRVLLRGKSKSAETMPRHIFDQRIVEIPLEAIP